MTDPVSWTTYVQTASWAGAAITAMIGVYKFGQDGRAGRAQRKNEVAARQDATRVAERELEWRRASMAQSVLEKMEDDPLAEQAMLMLDYDGRAYSSGEREFALSKEQVVHALRVQGEAFDHAEVHVRDAFDHLFWHFERIQHQIDVDVITLEHVKFPLAYLFALMEEDQAAFETFLKAYCYDGCLRLWDGFRRVGLPPVNAAYERRSDLPTTSVPATET